MRTEALRTGWSQLSSALDWLNPAGGSVAVTATIATRCAFIAASVGHCNIGNAARILRQRGWVLVVRKCMLGFGGPFLSWRRRSDPIPSVNLPTRRGKI